MPDWNTLFTDEENQWENLFEEVVSLVESHAIETDTWLPDIGADMGVPHHFSCLPDVVDLMSGFKVTRIFTGGKGFRWEGELPLDRYGKKRSINGENNGKNQICKSFRE